MRTFVSASWTTRRTACPICPVNRAGSPSTVSSAGASALARYSATSASIPADADIESPRSAPTAWRVSSSPSRASVVGTLHAREDSVAVGALFDQRARRLELNRQPGQRMSQDVVDLTRDPGRFLQARRAQLLLVRALGLGEQQLGLLRAHAGLATGRRGESCRDEPERVGEQTDAVPVVGEHRRGERQSSQGDDEERSWQVRAQARCGNRYEHEPAGGGVGRGAREDAARHRENVHVGRDPALVRADRPHEPGDHASDEADRDHQPAPAATQVVARVQHRPADQHEPDNPHHGREPRVQAREKHRQGRYGVGRRGFNHPIGSSRRPRTDWLGAHQSGTRWSRIPLSHANPADAPGAVTQASSGATRPVRCSRRSAMISVRPHTSNTAIASSATVHASPPVIECEALK